MASKLELIKYRDTYLTRAETWKSAAGMVPADLRHNGGNVREEMERLARICMCEANTAENELQLLRK